MRGSSLSVFSGFMQSNKVLLNFDIQQFLFEIPLCLTSSTVRRFFLRKRHSAAQSSSCVIRADRKTSLRFQTPYEIDDMISSGIRIFHFMSDIFIGTTVEQTHLYRTEHACTDLIICCRISTSFALLTPTHGRTDNDTDS